MTQQHQLQARFRLVILNNYDLSNLDLEFKIADFEREANQKHVRDIAEAIMGGNLFDNVITVMDRKDAGGAYEIIDGQHRYLALLLLFADGRLDTYTLALRVLSGVESRNAYRQLNNGRPLIGDDILKSYDDGTVKVFNKFRDYCVFYMTHTSKLYYSLVIKAIGYGSGTGLAGAGGERARLVKLALGLDEPELSQMLKMLDMLKSVCGGRIEPRAVIVKVPVFWTIARIYFQNYEETPQFTLKFTRFMKLAQDDDIITSLSKKGRNSLVLEEVEKQLREIWAVA